jgi:capsular polysaccharide biosynthesis protein
MNNNTFFNSIELIQLVKKWKKHLIVVGAVSLLGSVIFSSPLFIKPKYKSFALVYPSNLIAYSTESATEQMHQEQDY